MLQDTLSDIIRDQTERALWEVGNVIDCAPDEMWNRLYCDMPLWKHIYHMLSSLDRWYTNPRDKRYTPPGFHVDGLNDLDTVSDVQLTRDDINAYYNDVKRKVSDYAQSLTDSELLDKPDACEYTRFTLVLAQFRHLHSHMGMIMGFIIDDTGLWPRVVGLENPIPRGEYDKYL